MPKAWQLVRVRIFVFLALFWLLLPVTAGAYQLNSQAAEEETLTSGVVLQTLRLETDLGPINVYVLKVNLSDPYLKIDTIVGADGTLAANMAVGEMARRARAVAAVNGDFFQMKESGRPIGLLYQGGSLVASPAQRTDMYGFGFTKDRKPTFEIFTFIGQVKAGNGKSFPLAGINKPGYLVQSEASSDADSLTMYTPLWGTVSRGKLPALPGTVEVVVQGGVVKKVLTEQPGTAIPRDGYILKGHGRAARFLQDNLPVGAKVNVDYSVSPLGDKLTAAVGGQALLVENGQKPPYFSQNIAGNYARTAVGTDKDGKTLFLVSVEKSTVADGTVISRGMSQEELADFLISLGVWRAVNLDGGGSTTLAARHAGEFEPILVNRPQGGKERPVPDAIGLFSTAPPGKLAGLVIKGPKVMLAGTKAAYIVNGYDQYFNPVLVDPARASWKSAAGEFQGNILSPENGGSTTVDASLGGIKESLPVRVIGRESLDQLLVTPLVATLDFGQPVEFTVQVKTREGEKFALTTGDVDWDLKGEIGTLAGGKFTAGSVPGSGEATVTFQGFKAVIPITVRPPTQEIDLAPGNPAQGYIDGGIKLDFPVGCVTEPVRIKIAKIIEMPENLPTGLEPVGAINVELAAGSKPALTAPWRLTWQYRPDAIGARMAILHLEEKDGKWLELPSKIQDSGEQSAALVAKCWQPGIYLQVYDLRPAPAFKDTEKHWAWQQIADLARRGLVSGFPDGAFHPDQPVTRAQFAVMLDNVMRWPRPDTNPAFTDSTPKWAEGAIAAAYSRGVVKGYPDGRFAPDAFITRSEMASIMARALSLTGKEVKLSYKDAASIPEYARASVSEVTRAGVMQGGDGLFRPKDGATRAEAAAVVSRLCQLWLKQ